jgi:hypothetical protein
MRSVARETEAEATLGRFRDFVTRELGNIGRLPVAEREVALHRFMRAMEYMVARAVENPRNTQAWLRLMNTCPDITALALIARRRISPSARDVSIEPVKVTAYDAKVQEAVAAAARKARADPDSTKAKQVLSVLDAIPDAWLKEAGLERKRLREGISSKENFGEELKAISKMLEKHGLAIMSEGVEQIVLYKVSHTISSNKWENTRGVLVVPIEGEANPLKQTHGEFHQDTDQIFILYDQEHTPFGAMSLTGRQKTDIIYVHEFQHFIDKIIGVLDVSALRGQQEKTAVAREFIGVLEAGVSPDVLRRSIIERAENAGGTPHGAAYIDIIQTLESKLGKDWTSRPKEEIAKVLSDYIDNEYKRQAGITFTELMGTYEVAPTLKGSLDKLRGGAGKVAPGEEATVPFKGEVTKGPQELGPMPEVKEGPAVIRRKDEGVLGMAAPRTLEEREAKAKENGLNWSKHLDKPLADKANEMGIDLDVLFDAFVRYAKGRPGGTWDHLNDFIAYAVVKEMGKLRPDAKAKAREIKLAIKRAKEEAAPPKPAPTPVAPMSQAEANERLQTIMKEWGASKPEELFESFSPTEIREEMKKQGITKERIDELMSTHAASILKNFEANVLGKNDAGLLDAISEGGEAAARKWLKEQNYPEIAAEIIPRKHYREQLIDYDYRNSREFQLFAGLGDNVRNSIFLTEDGLKSLKGNEELARRFQKTVPEVEAALSSRESGMLKGTSINYEGGNLYNIDLGGGPRALFADEGNTATVIMVGDHDAYEKALNSFKKKGKWVKFERSGEKSLDEILKATHEAIKEKYAPP